MKIQRIDLYNFGSYYQLNQFDLRSNNEKRVVVIGGKNGAGKTTLFTAIQVCLYGNLAFGFKTAGSHYLRQIKTLVNNSALLDENENAYVEIEFEHVVNGEKQAFVMKRSWTWPNDKVIEALEVKRNEEILLEDDFNNFQNYLVHLIPPDLLKLYFFDGEKIADYFLGEQTINIQKALMVLSGNDTFEIISENIRRLLGQRSDSTTNTAVDYMNAQRELRLSKQKAECVRAQIANDIELVESITSEIQQLEKAYANKGGISLDQWTELHTRLKEEEEKRERLNWQRKALATDVLPFVILKNQIPAIEQQLDMEKRFVAHQALKSKIEDDKFTEVINKAMSDMHIGDGGKKTLRMINTIRKYFLDEDWDGFTAVLGLSQEEERQVLSVLERVKKTDPEAFKRYRRRITASINRSKEIRGKIQSSSIDEFEEFLKKKTEMEVQVEKLHTQIENQQVQIDTLTIDIHEREVILEKAKKAFEEDLKRQSMAALAGRMTLLLEDLEEYLFTMMIHSVEKDLKVKFGQMIRKKGFFDDIKIDRDWTVHIIRYEKIAIEDLLAIYTSGKKAGLEKKIGKRGFKELCERLGCHVDSDLNIALNGHTDEAVTLPIEMDKEQMSSGEKQIFVMSLYWALMQQSKNEMPFIIDTPFARIDTEHRRNITEKFFMELKGQLFILSTNEEISGNHLHSMEQAIAHVYMLEYGTDRKTRIHAGKYFEVQDGI